jgi:hypothetical protein
MPHNNHTYEMETSEDDSMHHMTLMTRTSTTYGDESDDGIP